MQSEQGSRAIHLLSGRRNTQHTSATETSESRGNDHPGCAGSAPWGACRGAAGGARPPGMCTGLNPRLASKACFLTVMTFLPAAPPLLAGCPCCFHASGSRAITVPPALRTRCFLASPPSQRGTQPPAWQRPGSQARAVGPGAWSVQTWGHEGWSSEAPLTASPHRDQSWLSCSTLRRREGSQVAGRLACWGPWPAHHPPQDEARGRAVHRPQHPPTAARRTSGCCPQV